ncbi:hypothetical protein Taro_051346, partial [Colocasia esculenta]|nr:hypothetical protein [Colocasia esculenta]
MFLFLLPTSGRSRLLSILPYLDDLHEMKSANWAVAIHEYLISRVKAFVTGAASSKTIFLTGCVPALGVSRLLHTTYVSIIVLEYTTYLPITYVVVVYYIQDQMLSVTVPKVVYYRGHMYLLQYPKLSVTYKTRCCLLHTIHTSDTHYLSANDVGMVFDAPIK